MKPIRLQLKFADADVARRGLQELACIPGLTVKLLHGRISSIDSCLEVEVGGSAAGVQEFRRWNNVRVA